MFEPSYIKMHEQGKLQKVAAQLYQHYDACTLCPRLCKVHRTNGERGFCQAGVRVKVSSAAPHYGEERPLVGRFGSGTIFLTHCNLLCLYCQNDDISHGGHGDEHSDEQLAHLMLRLQGIGCHNINFVTPTHYLPNIVQAVVYAVDRGLTIPLVYNTGGYDRVEIIQQLQGIFDIYMPDFKYTHSQVAEKYSPGANDYPQIAKECIKEMHRQVGILKTDDYHIARRGLIIRHLVLPEDLAGSEAFIKFVAQELDPGTYVNIMNQYRPCYKAYQFPELRRGIHIAEYQRVLNLARQYGLYNLD